MSSNTMKIAIHVVPTPTASGFLCRRWVRFQVAIGQNPLGPRGGHSGQIMDGEWASGAFRKPADAKEHAAWLAKQTGAQIV